MFELIRTGEKTYYFDLPSKIGVYTPDEKNAYLIDSGPHKDNAKKVLRILRERGWEVKAILNTHAHADHIGGNRYLQDQTNCLIFAADKETDLIRHTYLEPTTLYGANPHKDLQHKFLLAQESDALPFSDPRFPQEIEIIPLPGHSVEMVAFRTPDNTVFLADCLCSEQTLQKYGVTFQFNIEQCLASLDKAAQLQANAFVSSHAPTLQNIDSLVQLNRDKILQTAEFLYDLCKVPQTFDKILQSVFSAHGLLMSVEQHALVGSTVRSYLSYLYDGQRLRIAFDNNVLYYESV
ncbi:MAG: MBL fold metallo-hydrolase [Clostridia bacterium]|nr:MBL fold metallo-hydrolase [Clostridia bacterium]